MSKLTRSTRPIGDTPSSGLSKAAPSRPFQPENQNLSGGQSLDASLQQDMSTKFGHDFSQVRIHTDSRAHESAEAVGAQAYSKGDDIVFGAGRYDPSSPESHRLIAHELAHVVQQDKFGTSAATMRSRRSDSSEVEAENAANQVMSGNSFDVRSSPVASISCFDPSYNDVQDDFWGTKAALGKQNGSVADSAINTAWDAIGMTGIGGIASTGIDLAKAGYSEGMSTLYGWNADLSGDTADRMRSKQYDEAAGSFMGDAAVDATGMIPIYGQGQGVMSMLWDGARTADLASGEKPENVPSAGDIQKNIGKEIYNSATGPDPGQAPAQDSGQTPDNNQPPPNMPDDPFSNIP